MPCRIVFTALSGDKNLVVAAAEDYDQVVGQLQPGGWAHVTDGYGKKCFVNSANVAYVQEKDESAPSRAQFR